MVPYALLQFIQKHIHFQILYIYLFIYLFIFYWQCISFVITFCRFSMFAFGAMFTFWKVGIPGESVMEHVFYRNM